MKNMISREDVIDNLKYAISDYCTENIADFRDDIEFAINDMKNMQEIRKYMLEDESFEEMIDYILSKDK